MADVFVSYSRRDIEFVRELHTFLTRAGRDVWVDWEDIPPASEWHRDIAENVDGADSLLFVVSADSLASENCGVELTRALKGGKRRRGRRSQNARTPSGCSRTAFATNRGWADRLYVDAVELGQWNPN